MRDVVNALIAVIIPLSYVLVFLSTCILAFSIVAVGVFGGKLNSCSNPVALYPLGKAECAGVFILGSVKTASFGRPSFGVAQERQTVHVGFPVPNAWAPPRNNFDSIATSFVTLSQCVLFKWVDTMNRVRDITRVDQSPQEDANGYSALFFVSFLTVCGFFGFNLVLAFVVDAYHLSRGVGASDKMFEKFQRQIEVFRPQHDRAQPPSNRVSAIARKILYSSAYTNFVLSAIFLSGVFILATHSGGHGDDLPDNHDAFEIFINIQSQVLAFELFGEVILAVVALGPLAFLSKGWLVFDLLVAAGMAVGLMGQYSSFAERDNVVFLNFAAITRNMRAIRVLRVLTFLKTTRGILRTLLSCLPNLVNVLLLVVLIYMIISAVAVQWFGMVRYGVMIGPTTNVETFGQAIYLCYSVAFGGEWHIVLRDLMRSVPECTPEGPGIVYSDCGSPYQAVLFVFVIKIFAEGMILNLCIGMILDNFSFITDDLVFEENQSWSNGPSNRQVEVLATTFRSFDGGTGYLPLTALRAFLMVANRPLGFAVQDETKSAMGTAVDGEVQDLHHNIRQQFFTFNKMKMKSVSLLLQSDRKGAENEDLEMTAEERGIYKLIRAELNVMLRQKRVRTLSTILDSKDTFATASEKVAPHGSATTKKNLWAALFYSQSSFEANSHRKPKWGILQSKRKAFVSAVSFEEVLLASMLWKLPWMIPTYMRRHRPARVNEVVYMMHAITIKDFFRALVNKRAQLILNNTKKRMGVEEETHESQAAPTTGNVETNNNETHKENAQSIQQTQVHASTISPASENSLSSQNIEAEARAHAESRFKELQSSAAVLATNVNAAVVIRRFWARYQKRREARDLDASATANRDSPRVGSPAISQ